MSTATEDQVKTEAQGKNVPEEEVKEVVEIAKKARIAQQAADTFKDLATKALDPAEREKYLREAHAKEVEAHGHSKKARFLASGWGQGAMAGGGMGAALGGGLGTVVGTLVGGIVSIPTSALGALGGTAAGAIKGPFVKLPGMGGSDKDKGDAQGEEKESEEGFSEEDEAGHQAVLKAAEQAEELEKSEGKKDKSTDSSISPAKTHGITSQPTTYPKLKVQSSAMASEVQSQRSVKFGLGLSILGAMAVFYTTLLALQQFKQSRATS
ncbi:hypothetical protein PpBr36_01078 [Pyricularia pennisetigena]|uniref:hypothetical protein n=1 Tax=Pyricularia pennisetigena TaxID=1578925 RepID=UPI001150EC67|nr:hypothetical protein PpBr36_01078 [Pyricularia pennisetigena]TLS29691.1 hypothetical protein PpBr36_01078 [Pyricularia pennisetigena]